MADSVDSATAPETHQPKKALQIFGSLESPLHDATYMAAIAADMIEELTTAREGFPSIPGYLYCPEDEAGKLCFAVYHLQSMVSGLKDKFFEILKAEGVK